MISMPRSFGILGSRRHTRVQLEMFHHLLLLLFVQHFQKKAGSAYFLTSSQDLLLFKKGFREDDFVSGSILFHRSSVLSRNLGRNYSEIPYFGFFTLRLVLLTNG